MDKDELHNQNVSRTCEQWPQSARQSQGMLREGCSAALVVSLFYSQVPTCRVYSYFYSRKTHFWS